MIVRPEIRIVADADQVGAAGAEEFVRNAQQSIAERGRFLTALSGGSTPRRMHAILAGKNLPWQHIHFFWGDERAVPPDHQDSNYRMAVDTLLSKVPVPESNIHRMAGEEPDLSKAAEEYERTLRRICGEPPQLDLVFLGMGADGHTASMFPGTQALQEKERLVIANTVPKLQTRRITMTAPLLNQARQVIFLVSGKDKAAALEAVLRGPKNPDQFPAQLIRPYSGKLLWIIEGWGDEGEMGR